MKRCPICGSYASNDATTCFDCLYSYEHLAPLEEAKPDHTPSKHARIERIVVPPPRDVQSAEPPPTKKIAIPQKKKPSQTPSEPAASNKRSPSVITIRIECSDGRLKLESIE